MTWLNFMVVTLATWQIVEIWRHSEICGGLRSRAECWEGSSWRIVHFFGRLLACAYCLSIWVSTGLWLCLPEAPEPHVGWRIVRWLVYGLAASRLANLGNDLTHASCRTVRHDQLLPTSNTLLETTYVEHADGTIAVESGQPPNLRPEGGGDGGDGHAAPPDGHPGAS